MLKIARVWLNSEESEYLWNEMSSANPSAAKSVACVLLILLEYHGRIWHMARGSFLQEQVPPKEAALDHLLVPCRST